MVSILKRENQSEFVQRIGKGLERAYQETLPYDISIDLKSAKLIIFSDHHRGVRNGADDFRLSAPIYHAALAYYFNMGYTLVVLGDVEELWEEHPGPVVKVNTYSFDLERNFHEAEGRHYYRILGNHDDEWRREKSFKLLQCKYGKKLLQVIEGLHIHVLDGKDELGRLFLTHGHQGTLDSDPELGGKINIIAFLSKLLVHNVWRPFQRITKISVNTPASDFEMGDRHDMAMYVWSKQHHNTILITGHTHKPVFASQEHLARLKKELAIAQSTLALTPHDPDKQKTVSELAARLEWVKSKKMENRKKGFCRKDTPPHSPIEENPWPSYFNTGCCSFSDGNITGLEIANGAIQLVRWPDGNGKPLPKILEERFLADIFTELKARSVTG